MSTGSEPRSIAQQDETPKAAGRSARPSLEARLLRRLLAGLGGPPVEFQLKWSGERVALGTAPSIARVRISDRSTLRGLVRDSQIRFGDSYSSGQIEVEGDLVELVSSVFRSLSRRNAQDSIGTRVAGWLRRPRRNTLAGSRNNIHRHYDLGNEFYSLWLGETMAYTCAYYPTRTTTLERRRREDGPCLPQAAARRRGSVVEAGCGWGSLALHMAGRYGARCGHSTSPSEQIEFARRRARSSGMESRVEFIEDDYRNISGNYDAFVSVGMLEHVGPENYRGAGSSGKARARPAKAGA